MTENQIIELAAKEGAKAALETYWKQQELEEKNISKKRLRNIKLLLENYRALKAHALNAVYEAETIEEDPLQIIEDLMKPIYRGNSRVESIKVSANKTAIIVKHIDTMLDMYKNHCLNHGKEEERRWRVISALFIEEKELSYAEVADLVNTCERNVYKDVKAACQTLSTYMFGIDGIRKGN